MKKRKKNNKINQIINIIESIALLSLITFILLNATLNFTMPTIVHTIITVICFLLIGTIISIELFCFMIEKKKFKLITIAYYIVSFTLLALLTLVFPLFSIISLLICNIIKNIYRIKNISKIYDYDNFAAICKVYNIKTRRPRGTKKNTSTTKTTTKKTKAVAVKPKTKTTPAKKTSKSYA